MEHICNFSTACLPKDYYDVIVVGSGIAGLYTALNIDRNFKVGVLSKNALTENNTYLAQGGVAVAIKENDSPQVHAEDTLRAGNWVNDRRAVEVLVREARDNILNTVKMGVCYDRDARGELLCTVEGGHSRRRIIHAGGDATGRELQRGLLSALLKKDNVTVVDNAFAIDLIVKDNVCHGILALINDEKRILFSRAVVLATGGMGQVYGYTTNSVVATGDGIAMAYRAGAQLKDMEFVQFHPTTLYSGEYRKKYGRNFLISEAVRGEGGVLRNRAGRRFMEEVHPRGELAPRDIVARAIFREMLKEGEDYLYLDITHKDREYLMKRFPTIFSTCQEIGIDMSRDYIPVVPAAHYMMGGIKVDLWGRTSVSFLYACGECACTGVHGANRLASNSLLEGLVFSRRVARDINRNIINKDMDTFNLRFEGCTQTCKVEWEKIRERVGKLMRKKAGIIRTRRGLEEAGEELAQIQQALNKQDCTQSYQMETKNIVHVAMQVVNAALNRQKSCGAHYIVD